MSRTKTEVRLLLAKEKSEEEYETQLGAIQWTTEVEKKCADSTLTVAIQDEESLCFEVRLERLRNIYIKPNVEQYEPTNIIFDHCSLRDWLRQWQSYKNHGGTKPLRLLLSRPRGTSDVSNFPSLCWFLTPAQRRDEVAILSALHTAFGSPPAAAAETIFTKLINFSSDPQAN